MESTEKEVVMDEVAEQRPDTKKCSYTGTIIFLVFIALIAGAGWYFQSMWLPQVKQTYRQAQTMMHNFISPQKVDPMAAPTMSEHDSNDNVESAKQEDAQEHVVSVIAEPKVVVETKSVVEEIAEDSTAIGEPQKETLVTESKEVAENEKSELEANVEVEAKIEQKASLDDHQDVKVTFVGEPVVTKVEIKETEIAIDQPVTKSRLNVIKPDNDLTAARQAFWQRDLPKAEALYKQQISNDNASANSWGELGNIYYLQAKWQQAAFAYTEAALFLLDKGDFPQALFLRYIVSGLDPEQVKRIDQRLRALQAPVGG